MTKVCTKCQQEKPTSEFFPRYGSPGKLKPSCKKCDTAQGTDYKRRNPARRKKYAQTRWRLMIRKKFGLTAEVYERMLAAQGGGCAVCGGIQNNKMMAVDHDHVTGRVRGILCDRCNRGIGLLGDNPAILRNAADYIDQKQIKHLC